jgi:VWFA-related protein
MPLGLSVCAVAALALTILCGVSGHAQSAPPAGPPATVFRASVQLVQIDVVVSDAGGAAVATLGPSDFSVEQDGQTVPVQLATYVTGMPTATSSRTAEAGEPTRYVFFIDDFHLEQDNFVRMRDGLARFVERDVPQGAEMLLMFASFSGDKNFAFTTDRAALRNQIQRLQWSVKYARSLRGGGGDACDELSGQLRADMYSNGVMSTLAGLLSALHEVPGRKAVVLLSDGPLLSCREAADQLEHLRRLTDLANRSSTVLYGVVTAPFTSGISMPATDVNTAHVRSSNLPGDDVQYLADQTGGLAGRSNDIDRVLDRVAADQRGYYLLAYEPPPKTFGKGRLQYRNVKVHVTRPGLTVRARAGFYSVPDAALKLRGELGKRGLGV